MLPRAEVPEAEDAFASVLGYIVSYYELAKAKITINLIAYE